MIVGCVKEIKPQEYRVGVTPDQVGLYVRHGHRFLLEQGAGLGSGYSDQQYIDYGAEIVSGADGVWSEAELVIKVKEPLPPEYPLMRTSQIVFTFLHLAASRELTIELIERKVTGIAYETIEEHGELPCLKPMSEIAGRLSVQEGAKYLEKPFGGRGVLLGGVPGVRRGKVVIIGAGTVGSNALKMAVGLGADVTIMDIDTHKLTRLDDLYANHIQTIFSSEHTIRQEIRDADLVVGAVLVPGDSAPKLVRRSYLTEMKPGAVMVDVAIDQGGCFETSHLTYHDNPTFTVDQVVHYCVGNMPGSVPFTATLALTNATIRYGLALADLGPDRAIEQMPALRSGLNTFAGQCTNGRVAALFNIE
ncbi:MAG: alanine dehydrogenase [Bacillota bacterium]|nr:alanine dehydrogenase [Bacillota bacterium]